MSEKPPEARKTPLNQGNILALVNLEHISSASFTIFARSMYLAHLELINLSAVSKDCASSIHLAASLMLPTCCQGEMK